MRILLRSIASLTAVIAGIVVTPPGEAMAGTSPAGEFQLTFTSRQPSTATGMILHEVFLNPSNWAAKPSPVRRTVLQLPHGSVLDGAAIPACTASDAELMLLGPGGCPAASRIGQGQGQ